MQGNKPKALKSYLQINQFLYPLDTIYLQCLFSGYSVYLIPICSLSLLDVNLQPLVT